MNSRHYEVPFHRIAAAILLSLLALSFAAGCTRPALPDHEQRLPCGNLYYLDGAGGGTELVNWCGGVRDGLHEAGYPGACEMFTWQTGLGAVADQDADVRYKREKAGELANRIREYRKDQPDAPVSLIGLSAGTAVAVFTAEAMPDDCPIDTIVLLGASIGAGYDLTNALRHVRGKLYVFTSPNDGVLGLLMVVTGTADRQPGSAAGTTGFVIPAGATEETRKLYADKLVTIAWTKEFERVGNFGHHLDNVNKDFVRTYVAPVVMGGKLPLPLQQ
jgi:pimeloyl-ACP methyl ester carboxylesterase